MKNPLKTLNIPSILHCGQILPNRFSKAALTEDLVDSSALPNQRHFNPHKKLSGGKEPNLEKLNKKHILIIGGTGIIGKATVKEVLQAGYAVTTIGIKKERQLPKEVQQVIIDKSNQKEYKAKIGEINKDRVWDVVFDVFNLSGKDARETHRLFKNNARHIFIISTTLVYDRSNPYKQPITTNAPLAKKGTMGGYVDHKLELEKFWHSKKDVNWTILRPYHIVGAGSLLGCLPNHNRDPKLLQRIKNDQPLQLCQGGDVELNFIHPSDIAKIVLNAAGKPSTFGKAYNAVNPKKIIVRKYFAIIGKILNKKVIIQSKSIQDIWKENKGWQLTTLTHIYDTTDLERDTGFIPCYPIENAIKEAIEHYPKEQDIEKISVHERMTLLPRPKPIKYLTK